eukprot:1724944-Rhodomonas_salina.1
MLYAGSLRKRSELASTGNSHFLANGYKEATTVFPGKKRARVMLSLECPEQVRNLFEADDLTLIPFTFVNLNDEEAVKKNMMFAWFIRQQPYWLWAQRHPVL